MMYERVEDLLKRTMGLDARSIGTSAVSRAVEMRARACGIADAQNYWDHVSNDSAELQALVETVVVPETWFFRDREAFTAAAALLRAEWQSRPHDTLRLVSLPCSTGEEPYTLAMALIDAGLPPSAFRIDGIDISDQALQRARAGIYGRNSFRGSDLAYRDRHFTGTGTGYRISDAVRASVHFTRGNLLRLDHLNDVRFDIVFCRNLLIYFDLADQRRAAAVLGKLLAAKGVLFVGHSEASLLLGEGFAPLRIPRAFAFRMQDSATATRHQPPSPPVKRVSARPAAPSAPARRVVRAAAPVPPAPSATGCIEEIRRIADSGDVQTALRLGIAMLKDGKPTAETLHLLAVISDSAGDVKSATDYYRKALYLDPNHHEALTHLALLLDRQGDAASAGRMRERARRLHAREAG